MTLETFKSTFRHLPACWVGKLEVDGVNIMAGYMTYWPKEQVIKLEKAKDIGPIQVVFGSIHTKMPSIASVKVGNIIYPVTLNSGILTVLARLPVEKVESASDYLLRETGECRGALVPEGIAMEEKPFRNSETIMYSTALGLVKKKEELPQGVHIVPLYKPIPYLCHQEPFNCCAETAASGTHGSTIESRPISKEVVSTLLFGPIAAKQKPLRVNARGELTTISISGFVRKMSEDTQAVFDALFK